METLTGVAAHTPDTGQANAEGSTPISAAAFAFLTKLSTELSTGRVDLPCFPGVAVKIRAALSDSKTTIEQLMQIVLAEPRLAVQLVQTANSAAFNVTARVTEELRTAIVRLGLPLVQSTALAYAMRHLKSAHELRPIRRQLDDLWQSSVAVATIGRYVAQRAKLNPDEAFLTGLLSIIGKLYILVRAVSQAEEFACDPEFSLTIRSWHAGIGKAVVENWGFSSEIADAVGEQENNDRSINTDMVSLHDVNCKADLVDVMFVSLLLARALEFGDSAAVTGKESRAFSRLGLTEADCKTVILQAKQHTEVVQSSLGG